MTIADKTILVTRANRGIGQALVEEGSRRGAKRVYAGTRQPLAHSDGRVTLLTLDVTNAAQTQAAVEAVESLDILINNAGLALFDDLSDRAALEQHLAVNLFGTYGVTQAFLPLLTDSRGAIVNVLSVTAFAPLPFIPAYSISKAAAFSLSQAWRALLAGQSVRVHAVLAGPVDTDMSRAFDVPKASAESVARAIVDGVENGDEEIFPDPMAESMAQSWRRGAAKALEHQNASLVQQNPSTHKQQEGHDAASARQETLDRWSSQRSVCGSRDRRTWNPDRHRAFVGSSTHATDVRRIGEADHNNLLQRQEGEKTMTDHKTGTREEWMAARVELLAAEKALTRRGDEVARQRQELPWVPIDKEYRFETDEGTASLADLFNGRSQLLIYHFMFGPDYTAGCPSCSAIADGFDGSVVHLANHDVTLCAVSQAPLAKLQAYRRRMGWSFPWASSFNSDFNYDFRVTHTKEDWESGAVDYNYRTMTSGCRRARRIPSSPRSRRALERLADVQTTRARHERLRARGRRGLPHLLSLRARDRRPLGHVPVARPARHSAATRPASGGAATTSTTANDGIQGHASEAICAAEVIVPTDEEFLTSNQNVIQEFRANSGVVSQLDFPLLLLTTTRRPNRQANDDSTRIQQ